MTAIWMIALTIFLSSCRTVPGVTDSPENQKFELPVKVAEKPVKFHDTGSYFILTYDEYRNLEFNIIEMRRYIGELEGQIKKYRGDNDA